jgi:hypothetical protein
MDRVKHMSFASALFILMVIFVSFPATFRREQGMMFEIPLSTHQQYNQPVLDIAISCTFTGKNGVAVTIPAFWNGDSTYLVRYAFQDTGTWSYSCTSNQPSETEINNTTGSIAIVSTTKSNNPFLTKGCPVVSSNGHYFTYRNGDPFFLLANTAWEITWKSTLEQVKRFVSNQKMKNFNMVQLVVLSHQQMWPWGEINRNGDSAFLQWDFYKPNPKYMSYLDSIVAVMNDSGIIAGLTPLWAATTEVNWPPNGNYWKYMPKDQSLKWAKYIGSRYAGSNVLWIIAGDNYYPDVNGIRSFWRDFAVELKKASGPDHVLSMHCGTGVPSYEVFDNSTPTLDFHMYQSSHYMEGNNLTWQNALQGFRSVPPKPVIDDETCYEDIYDNLWTPGDTVSVYTYRIQPEHVRKAQYEAVLSGSIIGLSYGANGVFQWNVPGIPASHNPEFYADSAWDLPGSYQMSIARSILEKYQWYRFSPAPELLKSANSSFIPISCSDKYIMVYLQKHESGYLINTENFLLDSNLVLIDPKTGHETVGPMTFSNQGYWSLSRPDTNDWLAVCAIKQVFNQSVNSAQRTTVKYFFINCVSMYKKALTVNLFCPSAGDILFELFTVNGRQLYSKKIAVSVSGNVRQQILLGNSSAQGIEFLKVSGRNGAVVKVIGIR